MSQRTAIAEAGELIPRKSQPVPVELFGFGWLVVFVHTVVVVVVIAGVVAAVVIVIVEAIAVIVVAVVIADVIAVVIVAIAVVIAITVVVVIVVDVVVVATTSWSKTGSVSKVVWVNITTQHKQTNNMHLPPWTQPQRWLGHGVLLDMKKKPRVE